MIKKTIYGLIFLSLFSFPLLSDDNVKIDSGNQYNFYIGNFDFSDDKQAAVLFGLQHQNEKLERQT